MLALDQPVDLSRNHQMPDQAGHGDLGPAFGGKQVGEGLTVGDGQHLPRPGIDLRPGQPQRRSGEVAPRGRLTLGRGQRRQSLQQRVEHVAAEKR